MTSRSLLLLALAGSAGCQLPTEHPAQEPKPKPAVVMAAPLPPEETPPPHEPAVASAAPMPVEPGVAPTGAPRRGKLPKAVLDEQLASLAPHLDACYQQALEFDPSLRGVVDVNFVVGEDGKVAHADASDTEGALSHAPTVECILAAVRKLEFPQPRGGRVFVNYPLKLEPPAPASP